MVVYHDSIRVVNKDGPAGVDAPRDPAHSHNRRRHLWTPPEYTNDHGDDDDTVEAHYSGLERLELLAILKAPHACVGGFVYIGHLVEEDGEEVEVVEAVPCRRCAGEASRGG